MANFVWVILCAGKFSGTTATLVIVDGLTVTAACVGDSRCVLDAQGTVTALTIDHRLDTNDEECVPNHLNECFKFEIMMEFEI